MNARVMGWQRPGRKPHMQSVGVRREWGRRVHAEAHSAAVTAELFAALEDVGAPPSLLQRAHVIIGDELRHSALLPRAVNRLSLL